jgi:hypothetical protein
MPGVDEDLARLLQEGLDGLNEADPPVMFVPHFLNNPRHECTGARQSKNVGGKGISTATDTKERYVKGWEGTKRIDATQDDEVAIIYREGKCKKCGAVVRSETGRVVLTEKRPPATGRVARD